METQEFDEELQETNRIYKEIGDLNTKELLELQGAITQIMRKKSEGHSIQKMTRPETESSRLEMMVDLILTVRMSVCGWRSQWQAILTLGMVMGRVF